MKNTPTRLRPMPLLIIAVSLMGTGAALEPSDTTASGMVFLQFGDPVFRAGLEQHGLLGDAGYRLLNTGFRAQPFGDYWEHSEELASARASERPYFIDRITGGMPFQPLDGIDAVATALVDDPNFLGFQVHEWGNSPTHDYHRIHKLLFDKGLPLTKENFAPYEGRVEPPYFSGGNYTVYQELYRPISTQADAERYLEDYFRKINALTGGLALSVTGHGQLQHAAFRLGARTVMSEIGNQVPLTALQIACARGAARQYGKPFGTYYETWGGRPMGCVCATEFSPWWPGIPDFSTKMGSYRIGPEYGSSRSLHRRLMYYAWLSGSSWWAEEWGAENYFSNWEDYPLTEYGNVTRDFLKATRGLPGPEPVVPVAVVLPPDTFGIDIRAVNGNSDLVWRLAPMDTLHGQLRRFAKAFFAPQPSGGGRDAHNLTPSPWIGCFDVFDATVAPSLLSEYACALYFTEKQAKNSVHPISALFDPAPESTKRILDTIRAALPYHVEGDVGVAQARCGDRYLLGVFNNLGVTKIEGVEHGDPEATQAVIVRGATDGVQTLAGDAFLEDIAPGAVTLRIPAGDLAVLSFPLPK